MSTMCGLMWPNLLWITISHTTSLNNYLYMQLLNYYESIDRCLFVRIEEKFNFLMFSELLILYYKLTLINA